MPKPRIAVVIPTLNEQEALADCLPRIAQSSDQIVVSDGGSTDRTLEIAARHGARIVSAPRGRGIQLNAGVRACQADGYLFLHADTHLPGGALERVTLALTGGAVGGAFLVRFDSPRPVYRFGSTMVNLRTRLTRLPLGDQAQFASDSAVATLGGFREWPILEDLDFMRRLRRLGPIAILAPPVRTSVRRFERYGPVRTLANNWVIFTLFALGVAPERLRSLYPDRS